MVFLLSKTVLILLVTTRLRVTERESISTYSIYNQNPLKMEQPYYLPPRAGGGLDPFLLYE
jgi:hypothetical protein